MEVYVKQREGTPDFDGKIIAWVMAGVIETWGGPPLRIGIIHDFNGEADVYLAIVGDSWEMQATFPFLESLGLVDLGIYHHPEFNCIYGIKGRLGRVSGKWKASCLDADVITVRALHRQAVSHSQDI